MTHPFLLKIDCYTRLSQEEREHLDSTLKTRTATFEARRDIVRQGETPGRFLVITDGWACRYKFLPDGRRQIMSFLLPGDLCDSHMPVLEVMDHSIGTLSAVTASNPPREAILSLIDGSPRIKQALWWDSLVAASIQREWTVSIGRRDATERMAHLFVELLMRLRNVGRAPNDTFDMPATQGDLADALGITPVHTNRTLQSLRAAGMVQLDRRKLTVGDVEKLKHVALFDSQYLHLGHEGRQLSANEE